MFDTYTMSRNPKTGDVYSKNKATGQTTITNAKKTTPQSPGIIQGQSSPNDTTNLTQGVIPKTMETATPSSNGFLNKAKASGQSFDEFMNG